MHTIDYCVSFTRSVTVRQNQEDANEAYRKEYLTLPEILDFIKRRAELENNIGFWGIINESLKNIEITDERMFYS